MPVSRITVLQYIVLVPITELCLRTIGLKSTWQALNATTNNKPQRSNVPRSEVLQSLASLKQAMQITPMENKCLARSLVFWWQLKRKGVNATLNIGVSKKKIFKAHAWLEIDGQILNAGKHVRERYKSIAQFEQPKDMT
ncbi:MAG: lasso peptide biosynthesis B2 protein [Parasphingorhabdus sp.]|uniref:lasso peptide biosynthesis B2 protein n=1 Tax=Parasphingorhabdus sp. TaxID=2709688 RepID=UPI003263CFA2